MSSPSSTPVLAAPVLAAPVAEAACAACPHPAAGHDPIGRRFCAATLDSSITRGCICR